ETERDAAQERADRIAKAAEHGDDETFKLITVAREDGERKQRADQHAGHAGERDADRPRWREPAWSECLPTQRLRGYWQPRARLCRAAYSAERDKARRRSPLP